MSNPLHPHLSSALAQRPRTVSIDGRSYPAGQRDLVAASLLLRPDRVGGARDPRATWTRS